MFLALVVGLSQASHGSLARLVILERLCKSDDRDVFPGLGSCPVLLQHTRKYQHNTPARQQYSWAYDDRNVFSGLSSVQCCCRATDIVSITEGILVRCFVAQTCETTSKYLQAFALMHSCFMHMYSLKMAQASPITHYTFQYSTWACSIQFTSYLVVSVVLYVLRLLCNCATRQAVNHLPAAAASEAQLNATTKKGNTKEATRLSCNAMATHSTRRHNG